MCLGGIKNFIKVLGVIFFLFLSDLSAFSDKMKEVVIHSSFAWGNKIINFEADHNLIGFVQVTWDDPFPDLPIYNLFDENNTFIASASPFRMEGDIPQWTQFFTPMPSLWFEITNDQGVSLGSISNIYQLIAKYSTTFNLFGPDGSLWLTGVPPSLINPLNGEPVASLTRLSSFSKVYVSNVLDTQYFEENQIEEAYFLLVLAIRADIENLRSRLVPLAPSVR
jgi:hypothetical protein